MLLTQLELDQFGYDLTAYYAAKFNEALDTKCSYWSPKGGDMSVNSIVKKSVLALSVAGVMAASQSALAYEKGDIIVRAGAALVEPDESSSPIFIETLNLGAAGNAQAGVDNDMQFGITGTYMLSNKVGVELLAATPFNHDIAAAGTIAGAGKIAETTHLPPTLTVNYFFNDPASAFQPYIGAGVNYTIFFDEDVTPTLDNAGTLQALANLAGAGLSVDVNGNPTDFSNARGTDIDLENSVGLALHLGFDYAITENLGLNVAYWNINIDTTADISSTVDSVALGNGVGIKAHVDVDIDPHVYMAGLYYKF